MLFILKAKSISKSVCFCFDVKAKSKANEICFCSKQKQFFLLFCFAFCFSLLLRPSVNPTEHFRSVNRAVIEFKKQSHLILQNSGTSDVRTSCFYMMRISLKRQRGIRNNPFEGHVAFFMSSYVETHLASLPTIAIASVTRIFTVVENVNNLIQNI